MFPFDHKSNLMLTSFVSLGDRVRKHETGEFNVSVTFDQLKGGDIFRIYSQSMASFLINVFTGEHQSTEKIRLQNDGYSLLRLEVLNKEKERIAFTNPIYISIV